MPPSPGLSPKQMNESNKWNSKSPSPQRQESGTAKEESPTRKSGPTSENALFNHFKLKHGSLEVAAQDGTARPENGSRRSRKGTPFKISTSEDERENSNRVDADLQSPRRAQSESPTGSLLVEIKKSPRRLLPDHLSPKAGVENSSGTKPDALDLSKSEHTSNQVASSKSIPRNLTELNGRAEPHVLMVNGQSIEIIQIGDAQWVAKDETALIKCAMMENKQTNQQSPQEMTRNIDSLKSENSAISLANSEISHSSRKEHLISLASVVSAEVDRTMSPCQSEQKSMSPASSPSPHMHSNSDEQSCPTTTKRKFEVSLAQETKRAKVDQQNDAEHEQSNNTHSPAQSVSSQSKNSQAFPNSSPGDHFPAFYSKFANSGQITPDLVAHMSMAQACSKMSASKGFPESKSTDVVIGE